MKYMIGLKIAFKVNKSIPDVKVKLSGAVLAKTACFHSNKSIILNPTRTIQGVNVTMKLTKYNSARGL